MSPPTDRMAGYLTVGRHTRAHVMARWATLAAGVICSVAAWLDVGAGGLVAGALATLLVIGFLWSGLLPLFAVRGKDASMAAGLGILLLMYTARLAVVLIVLVLSRQWEFVNRSWVGVTIIACALTWIAVHVAVTMQRRKGGTPAEHL